VRKADMREAHIKMSKCLLILDENVIWKYIPRDIIAEGIGRGKGYLRAKRVEEYEKKKAGKE
jgi:hypothetical protein